MARVACVARAVCHKSYSFVISANRKKNGCWNILRWYITERILSTVYNSSACWGLKVEIRSLKKLLNESHNFLMMSSYTTACVCLGRAVG